MEILGIRAFSHLSIMNEIENLRQKQNMKETSFPLRLCVEDTKTVYWQNVFANTNAFSL